MDALSQRENIALTLHFVQPQEYIEYFEDSADGCALRLEKMHFVSLRAKFEPDADIGQKGTF